LSYKREKLIDIHNRINEAIEANQKIKFSFRNVLAATLAGISHLLHSQIENISKNSIPTTAKETLDEWAKVFGVARKKKTRSRGSVTLNVSKDLKIEKLEFISDEQQFYIAKNLNLKTGVVSIPVEAKELGEAGNLINKKIKLLNTHKHIEISDNTDFTGGSDQETDDYLRERLLQYMKSHPQSGSLSDYINWMKKIKGVQEGFVVPTINGPGTVGVCALTEKNHIPNKKLEDKIKEKLQVLSPATAEVIYIQPTKKEVELKISLSPNSAKIRRDVNNAILKFFEKNRAPHGWFKESSAPIDSSIKLSKLSEVISLVEGEDSHKIISPTTDIVPKKGEVLYAKL
jgi:uncharacterized phage protein gp47/JayE